MSAGADEGRHETPKERTDRNLNELLAGLRVALPGVQVLFAFLLILPFNQRFALVTGFQEKVYFVTLLCTALAAVLLIAPSIHHRLLFRRDVKEQILYMANGLTIAGLSVLAVAMTGVILLITDFLFDTVLAICVTAAIAAAFGGVWYLLPMRIRRARRA